MKKIINIGLIAVGLLCASLQSSYGAVVTSGATYSSGVGTNKTSLYQGTFQMLSVTTVNPTLTTVYVTIFDSPGLSVTNVYNAYTQYVQSVVSYTNIYTNFFGVPTTNIYDGLTNTATSVAQSTNLYKILDAYSVPPSSTFSKTYPAQSTYGMQGLLFTNTLTNFTHTATIVPYR